MINGPTVATHWTDNGYGVLFTNRSGVLYGQNFADPAVIRIRLNTVRATLRVTRTAPRLARVVRNAQRVPNQRLHRTVAVQPPVAPRLPVSRGAVSRRVGHDLAPNEDQDSRRAWYQAALPLPKL